MTCQSAGPQTGSAFRYPSLWKCIGSEEADERVDTCSVINLTNVGALMHVLALTKCRVAVPPLVLAECNINAAQQVAIAEAEGLLDYVNDDDVPADRYFELLDQLKLGEGETECIAIAEQEYFTVCCDDRRQE